MMTRKSIDTILLSVDADKLSQREWDYRMKMLNPIDPSPVMVAKSMLERQSDIAALSSLQTSAPYSQALARDRLKSCSRRISVGPLSSMPAVCVVSK